MKTLMRREAIIILILTLILSPFLFSQIDSSWTCPDIPDEINPSPPSGSTIFNRCEGLLINYDIQTAVVFVDFPSGRVNGINQPMTSQEVWQVADIDAVGNLGRYFINPNTQPQQWDWVPFKYAYISYWNKYFSAGSEWYDDGISHPHPDYQYLDQLNNPNKRMLSVQPKGSLKQYFNEVSDNNLRITPATTHQSGIYRTGIVNKTLNNNSDPTRIDWIMIPHDKSYYRAPLITQIIVI